MTVSEPTMESSLVAGVLHPLRLYVGRSERREYERYFFAIGRQFGEKIILRDAQCSFLHFSLWQRCKRLNCNDCTGHTHHLYCWTNTCIYSVGWITTGLIKLKWYWIPTKTLNLALTVITNPVQFNQLTEEPLWPLKLQSNHQHNFAVYNVGQSCWPKAMSHVVC